MLHNYAATCSYSISHGPNDPRNFMQTPIPGKKQTQNRAHMYALIHVLQVHTLSCFAAQSRPYLRLPPLAVMLWSRTSSSRANLQRNNGECHACHACIQTSLSLTSYNRLMEWHAFKHTSAMVGANLMVGLWPTWTCGVRSR